MRFGRVVASALLVVALPAFAATCPAVEGGSVALARLDSAQRAHFIRARLSAEAPRARVYTEIWGLLFGVGTLAQIAAAGPSDPGDQVDLDVGAISTAVGVAALTVTPLTVMEPLPAGGGDDCAALAQLEQRLIRDARGEADGRSLLIHGANAAFSVALGLVLGLGFGRWTSAIITAVAGIAIGEAFIWTQPAQLPADLERYRSGELPAGPSASLSFVF